MTDFLCPKCGPISEETGTVTDEKGLSCAGCQCPEDRMAPLIDAYDELVEKVEQPQQTQGEAEPLAFIYPADLEKLKSTECSVRCFSVMVGRPGGEETSVPLYEHAPATATVLEDCSHCGGTGDVSGEPPGIACPLCNGTGVDDSLTINGWKVKRTASGGGIRISRSEYPRGASVFMRDSDDVMEEVGHRFLECLLNAATPAPAEPNNESDTVNLIVSSITDLASKFDDPSPIDVARAISCAATFIEDRGLRNRVIAAANHWAKQYGDWCGGFVNPKEVGEKIINSAEPNNGEQ